MPCAVVGGEYGLTVTIQKVGEGLHDKNFQYGLYVWKESMPSLIKIVGPYMIPSMMYKLHNTSSKPSK